MNPEEVNGTVARATLLSQHDPPRRFKPNYRMAQLLDLPDEILAAIFEHFAAGRIRRPVLQGNFVYELLHLHRDLCSIYKVNKRVHKIALPLLWRHMHRRFYYSIRSELSALLRGVIRSSRIKTNFHDLSLSLQLVTSLTIDYSIDEYTGYDADDASSLEIVNLCKNLRYLKLNLFYAMLRKDKQDPHISLDFAIIQKLGTVLSKLRHLVHLFLEFGSEGLHVPWYEQALSCPAERYIVALTEFRIDSLQGLTLCGLSDIDHNSDFATVDLDASFNYPALTMISFADSIPGRFVEKVLERLKAVAKIRTLCFDTYLPDILCNVPIAMRPDIVHLHISGKRGHVNELCLLYRSLQSLSCRAADACYPLCRPQAQLRTLTLKDDIQGVVEWVEQSLSQQDYMPNLRILRVYQLSPMSPAHYRQTIASAVPSFRNIAVEVLKL